MATRLDLEFGKLHVNKNIEKLINYVKNNVTKLKKMFMLFVVATIFLIVKKSIHSIDDVCADGSAITLNEEPYQSFHLNEDIDLNVDSSTRKFVLKTSHVNRRMQFFNLNYELEKINKYLDVHGYVCLPMKYFGVNYDIIVFQNLTMINPYLEETTLEEKFIQEQDLKGNIKMIKRSNGLKISYYDDKLENIQSTWLWYDQAYCFAHYYF